MSVNKESKPTTISLADVEGLVDWASAMMLRPGIELANAEDMKIPRCVDNAEQAIAIVREHHASWQAAAGKAA